jgi:hypothetical protein
VLVALATVLVVVTGASARGSMIGQAHPQATSTLTTIGPSAFNRETCVEHLESTIVALRPQPSLGTYPNDMRPERAIDAAQRDLTHESARLNSALNATVVESCTNAATADRVTRCLSGISDVLRSITDRAVLALGYASFALQVAPTTQRNQTLAMDLAVLHARKTIESSLREEAQACTPMPTR